MRGKGGWTPEHQILDLLRKGHPCDQTNTVCDERDAASGCFCSAVADEVDRLRALLKEAGEALVKFRQLTTAAADDIEDGDQIAKALLAKIKAELEGTK